jgi:adenosylcobinamide-phosphate synthase
MSQFLYGMLMLVLALPTALLPAAMTRLIARRARAGAIRHGNIAGGFIIAILLEGIALKPFFALRMLADAGRRVRVHLEQDNLEAARQELQALVGRDRSQLTAELVGAATIESLAENLSDSVVAPLFYYLLFDLPGAATYRLFNTFDSMIGYHGRYEYLGKAAARLDDILNFLPSRITALLIIAGAPLFGGKRGKAWRIWRRDAHKTASPNAGHPMATAAGALGVQLEKVGHYMLGDNERAITTHDIQRAEQMVWWIGGGAILLTGFIKMFCRRRNEELTLANGTAHSWSL